MFADYQREILRCYQEKKKANELLNKLMLPTPAGLRTACTIVFEDRYHRNDEKILRGFFGHCENQKALMHAIENTEADKFRPLNNLLKGGTTITEEQNVELLAWLIDFQPRPYQFGFDYSAVSNNPTPQPGESVILHTTQPLVSITTETVLSTPEETPIPAMVETSAMPEQQGFRRVIFFALAAAAILSAYFVVSKPAAESRLPPANIIQKKGYNCMYWAGDRYVSGPCKLISGKPGIKLYDSVKVAHFRRITTPDTITKASIRKVWYTKIKGKIGFYTDSGRHPIDTQQRLLPMTKSVFRRYVLSIKLSTVKQ